MSTLAGLTSGGIIGAGIARDLALLPRPGAVVRLQAESVVTEPRPSGSVFRGQSATRHTGGGMERREAIKHIARQRGLSKREVYQAVTGS